MTSVVDTSVKYYSSLMSGAPVLSGQAGAKLSLLVACLKDGFDTKVLASLVVAGGVATCTWVGTHSALPDSVILVSGVTGGPTGWADLNGEQKVVLKASGTTCTFATAVSDGTATGTISIKMAPLGWLQPFSATNIGVFQSADPTSTKCLFRIDDSNAQQSRVVAYETMSDVNTGLGPFPTAAQMSGGLYWSKSAAASAGAVQWTLFGDGKIFYLSVQPSSVTGAGFQIAPLRFFGDFISLRPGGDPYCCGLGGSVTVTLASQIDGSLTATDAAFWMPRAYTGLGSAVTHAQYAYQGPSSGASYSGVTAQLGAFPSPIDGTLWVTPKYICAAASQAPRANIPGLLHVPMSGLWDFFKMGDRAPGSGALAGRNLIAITGTVATAWNTGSSSANTGIAFFDATGPWR